MQPPRQDAMPLGLGAGAGLPRLQLSPATASADDRPHRWSMDLASSVHSDSGWEMLSARDGQHSHCGSSPRSLSPSDTYDSEAEAAEHAAERAADAAAHEAALPQLPAAPAAAADEPLLEAFGSLVLAQREEAAGGGGGSASGASSMASSPRSSYGRPSTQTSRHDLYSLSQVCPARLGCTV